MKKVQKLSPNLKYPNSYVKNGWLRLKISSHNLISFSPFLGVFFGYKISFWPRICIQCRKIHRDTQVVFVSLYFFLWGCVMVIIIVLCVQTIIFLYMLLYWRLFAWRWSCHVSFVYKTYIAPETYCNRDEILLQFAGSFV